MYRLRYITSKFSKHVKFTKYSTKVAESGIEAEVKEVRASKYEKRFKSPMVRKWIRYWHNIWMDYVEAAKEVQKDVIEKPVKAVAWCSLLSFFWYSRRTNPDMQSFRDLYLHYSSDVLLVSPTAANPNSIKHLRFIEDCYNRGTIRYMSIGVMSFMWEDVHNNTSCTYDSRCSYLGVRYMDFLDRIIDIGFLNRWWILPKHMIDYDINY